MSRYTLMPGYSHHTGLGAIFKAQFEVKFNNATIFSIDADLVSNDEAKDAIAHAAMWLHQRSISSAREDVCKQLRDLIGAASPGDIVAATYTGR